MFSSGRKILPLAAGWNTARKLLTSAQWGREKLPGVKAAEYRLTSPADGKHTVFSFCMCPGGIVVPAAAYPNTNIVNGMSYYRRGGNFANAACVAGIHPDELAGKTVSPLEALEILELLEQQFYQITGNYSAPACSISSFLNQKSGNAKLETSYPLGLVSAPLWELLPKPVVKSMQAGLQDFIRKMHGLKPEICWGWKVKHRRPFRLFGRKTDCVPVLKIYTWWARAAVMRAVLFQVLPMG